MFTSAVIAVAKLVGFLLVCASAILSFYAAVHTIAINSSINLFFAGLVGLVAGIVAGPLYCLLGFYGLDHYYAFTPLGAALAVIPVFGAWCLLVVNVARQYLRG